MCKGDNIFRHIVEKNHDDWKYSIHLSIGPADNRKEIKVRGDIKEEVLADFKSIKEDVLEA